MHSSRLLALGLLLGLALTGSNASAQFLYPRGYGGYGMSRFGADPAAGYMAGLGAYARGQGVYALKKAQADAINLETMLKWNKALRARQIALREEARKQAIVRDREAEARAATLNLEDGTTLNDLLLQIVDSDPGVTISSRAREPLSAEAIREIPFEWDSMAITLCVDQMTGTDSLPPLLMDRQFLEERKALRAAVVPALKEDAHGKVSPATRKRLVAAIHAFQASFSKKVSEFEPGFDESKDFLTTLAGLSGLLDDSSLKVFLARLDDGEQRTVGDLIAFMNAFNLRFGPASSERQIGIYRRLVPSFVKLRDQFVAAGQKPSTPDQTGEGLKSAAKAAFKGMDWNELAAHAKTQ